MLFSSFARLYKVSLLFLSQIHTFWFIIFFFVIFLHWCYVLLIPCCILLESEFLVLYLLVFLISFQILFLLHTVTTYMIQFCVVYVPDFNLIFVKKKFQTCTPAILPPLQDIYTETLTDDLKGTFQPYLKQRPHFATNCW